MHDVKGYIPSVTRDLGINGPVIVGGSTALAHLGWTTQICRLPEVLCRCDRKIDVTGIRFRPRSPRTLDILVKWASDVPFDGLQVLMPEMAIADAVLDRLRGGQTHIYDPDDIDPDEPDDMSGKMFRKALAALDATDEEMQQALANYGDLLDLRSDGSHYSR